jgi:hypothetical protein
VSIYNLNWYLPDHLTPFSDLLPTPNPEPLVVPTPRTLQSLPRHHFMSQTYGPFGEENNKEGKLIMPQDRPLRQTEGEAVNHREPPTRVRYPIKRVTTGEMRKRVRNMLEYVVRVQTDEARRADRAKLIKIPTESAPRPRLPPLEEELNGISRSRSPVDGEEGSGEADVEMKEPEPPEPPGRPLPSSSQLLDELTRDLIAFQEASQTGDFDSLSFVAPPPPELPPVREEAKTEPASKAEPEASVPEAEAEAEVETEAEPERSTTVDPKSADALRSVTEDEGDEMDVDAAVEAVADDGEAEAEAETEAAADAEAGTEEVKPDTTAGANSKTIPSPVAKDSEEELAPTPEENENENENENEVVDAAVAVTA